MEELTLMEQLATKLSTACTGTSRLERKTVLRECCRNLKENDIKKLLVGNSEVASLESVKLIKKTLKERSEKGLQEAFSYLWDTALNLLINPKRTELQSFSLYQGPYIYYISKLDEEARPLLKRLGYQDHENSDDPLVWKRTGDVERLDVARLAVELLFAKQLLGLLKEVMKEAPCTALEALNKWMDTPKSATDIVADIKKKREEEEQKERARKRKEQEEKERKRREEEKELRRKEFEDRKRRQHELERKREEERWRAADDAFQQRRFHDDDLANERIAYPPEVRGKADLHNQGVWQYGLYTDQSMGAVYSPGAGMGHGDYNPATWQSDHYKSQRMGQGPEDPGQPAVDPGEIDDDLDLYGGPPPQVGQGSGAPVETTVGGSAGQTYQQQPEVQHQLYNRGTRPAAFPHGGEDYQNIPTLPGRGEPWGNTDLDIAARRPGQWHQFNKEQELYTPDMPQYSTGRMATSDYGRYNARSAPGGMSNPGQTGHSHSNTILPSGYNGQASRLSKDTKGQTQSDDQTHFASEADTVPGDPSGWPAIHQGDMPQHALPGEAEVGQTIHSTDPSAGEQAHRGLAISPASRPLSGHTDKLVVTTAAGIPGTDIRALSTTALPGTGEFPSTALYQSSTGMTETGFNLSPHGTHPLAGSVTAQTSQRRGSSSSSSPFSSLGSNPQRQSSHLTSTKSGDSPSRAPLSDLITSQPNVSTSTSILPSTGSLPAALQHRQPMVEYDRMHALQDQPMDFHRDTQAASMSPSSHRHHAPPAVPPGVSECPPEGVAQAMSAYSGSYQQPADLAQSDNLQQFRNPHPGSFHSAALSGEETVKGQPPPVHHQGNWQQSPLSVNEEKTRRPELSAKEVRKTTETAHRILPEVQTSPSVERHVTVPVHQDPGNQPAGERAPSLSSAAATAVQGATRFAPSAMPISNIPGGLRPTGTRLGRDRSLIEKPQDAVESLQGTPGESFTREMMENRHTTRTSGDQATAPQTKPDPMSSGSFEMVAMKAASRNVEGQSTSAEKLAKDTAQVLTHAGKDSVATNTTGIRAEVFKRSAQQHIKCMVCKESLAAVICAKCNLPVDETCYNMVSEHPCNVGDHHEFVPLNQEERYSSLGYQSQSNDDKTMEESGMAAEKGELSGGTDEKHDCKESSNEDDVSDILKTYEIPGKESLHYSSVDPYGQRSTQGDLDQYTGEMGKVCIVCNWRNRPDVEKCMVCLESLPELV